MFKKLIAWLTKERWFVPEKGVGFYHPMDIAPGEKWPTPEPQDDKEKT